MSETNKAERTAVHRNCSTIAETIEWLDKNLPVDRDYHDFRVWKLDRFDPMKGGAIVFDGTFLCLVGRSENDSGWHRVGIFPKTIQDVEKLVSMTNP